MRRAFTLCPLLFLLFACKLLSPATDPKRFDPYKGTLNDLLPKEISVAGAGKLQQQSIAPAHVENAKDAVRAQYKYSAAGFYVVIDCLVVNYDHSGKAGAAIFEASLRDHPKDFSTKTKNGRAVGSRYTANDGKTIIWTDGSLVIQISSTMPKPLENFEEAMEF